MPSPNELSPSTSSPVRTPFAQAIERAGEGREHGLWREAAEAATEAIRLAPNAANGWVELALAHIGGRRDAEALDAARNAVNYATASPPAQRAAAQRALALALLRLQRPEEAEQALTAALGALPGYPEGLATLAVLRMIQGRPAEADALFRQATAAQVITLQVTATRSTLAETTGNHAALLARLGRTAEALHATERAIALKPFLSAPQVLRGTLLRLTGHPDRGFIHLRRAFAAAPDDPDIARNLAALLLDAGRAEEAASVAHGAAEADPRSLAGQVLLGRARAKLGRIAEAEAAFQAALRLDPARADTWLQAGTAFLHTGHRAGALSYLRRLCRLAPGEPRHWGLLAQALRGVRFASADEELRADLLAALVHPGADNAHLAEAAAGVVQLAPAMAQLREALGAADPDAAARGLFGTGALAGLAGDGLLAALLEGALIPDPELERILTLLRRVFLAAVTATLGGPDPVPLGDPTWLPFLCALAGQCFLNEYAFAESAEETMAVTILAARLEVVLAAGAAPAPARVALLAAYRPLHRWSGAERLPGLAEPASEPFARLLRRQVEEPLAEERLKAGIPRLTPVEDGVSNAVRAQYEENPYPRWADAGLLGAPIPLPALLRALLPHAVLEPGPWWDAPELLVAGCGTGRESAWAANHVKGARVLAVDLSLTSLAYAERQSRRLGLAVEHAQADILRLGTLERRFDVIQSVGVLHHMADPLEGLRVLTGLLRPHGVMKIGLYSERARQPIVAARRFAAEKGYGFLTPDIRRFRQDVLALPEAHPVKPVTCSPDFFSTSACRDLVFHVQEHRHTLPQIAGWLDDLGLEFLGFQLEDQAVAERYRARFPGDPAMTDLGLWDCFEAEFPYTFGELYQFWVRRRP